MHRHVYVSQQKCWSKYSPIGYLLYHNIMVNICSGNQVHLWNSFVYLQRDIWQYKYTYITFQDMSGVLSVVDSTSPSSGAYSIYAHWTSERFDLNIMCYVRTLPSEPILAFRCQTVGNMTIWFKIVCPLAIPWTHLLFGVAWKVTHGILNAAYSAQTHFVQLWEWEKLCAQISQIVGLCGMAHSMDIFLMNKRGRHLAVGGLFYLIQDRIQDMIGWERLFHLGS